jgi:hypothetical protein
MSNKPPTFVAGDLLWYFESWFAEIRAALMRLQRLSSLGRNHFSCLIAFLASLIDLRLLGHRAAPVNLIGAAEPEFPQSPPSVKAMSSLVFGLSPRRVRCCRSDAVHKLLQYNCLRP